MLRHPKKTCISKTLFDFSILDIFKNVQNPFPFLLLGKNMSNYIYYPFFNLKKLIKILEIIYIIKQLKEISYYLPSNNPNCVSNLFKLTCKPSNFNCISFNKSLLPQ